MDTLAQDFAFALRLMRKNAGFSLVAVLTLALGVGVNTAMFSIVDAVLLRQLQFPDSERLVKITFDNRGLGMRDVAFSVLEMDDLRQRADVFSDVSVVWPVSANLTGAQQPQRMEFLGISPGYFDMLGAKPQLGRLIGSQDEAPGFAETVVISDALWRGAYGADPAVIGKSLRLDNDPYIVVGVLPPGFRHPGRTVSRDVEGFASAGYRADPFPKPARNNRFLPGLIGRLKPGVALEQAQARLDTLADALRREYPNDYPAAARWSVTVQPLREALVGQVSSMLLVLQGAVLLIVIIATVNIANLMVARASSRQREMAVRLALGASNWRLIRQLLAEALVLSFAGGLAGVLAATGALALLLRKVPARIPRLDEVTLGPGVLAFALIMTLAIGAVLGLVLALHAARPEMLLALREGSQGSGHGAKTSRMRSALIVLELSLAVVLMIGAGLLLRTFWQLLRENPGFNPGHVVTASVWLPVPNDPKADYYADFGHQSAFHRNVVQRLQALEGVEIAALASVLPASGPIPSAALTIEGRASDSIADRRTEVIAVTPGYFKALQTPLVRGRLFDDSDQRDKQQVAIVDRATARRFWPDEDPIGRRIKLANVEAAPWITIVGLIDDVKQDGLDSSGVPHLYRPLDQQGSRSINVLLRTALPAARLEPSVRREISAVDPALPVFNVRAMDDILGVSLAPRRFSAWLVGAFGVLALLLSSIGIYGLLAYMVSQRTREIGIRLALGARPSHVFGLILVRGTALATGGVVIGVLLAAVLAPALRAVLYGVPARDPAIFTAVPLMLLAVAVLASALPARRAVSVDPMIALRDG